MAAYFLGEDGTDLLPFVVPFAVLGFEMCFPQRRCAAL